MLFQRLLTAAIGVPLIGLAVWLGSYWLVVSVAVIAVLGTWEFHKLISSIVTTPPLALSVAIVIGLILTSQWSDEYLLIFVGIAVVTSLTWHTLQKIRTKIYRFHFLGLAGPFYIGVPLSLAILIRDTVDGRDWLLTALLITFSIDTAAYSVGRLIGKRKLAPWISPGKTWEGVVGALLAGEVVAIGLTLILELPIDLWMASLFGILLVIAAILGDLTESWLKRSAGAKDSGTLIPGHGGVLDRADSAIATLVITYFWVMWAV